MTLCTSDNNSKDILVSAFWQLIFGLFCALFGAIYEVFSHEVYSYYMIYAFAIPIVLGTLAEILFARYIRIQPPGLALSMWNMAVLTLTVGCLFKGVIEIYGTTNRMVVVYPDVSGFLALLAILNISNQIIIANN